VSDDDRSTFKYSKPSDIPDIQTLRRQAEALQPLDLHVDVGKLAAFAPADKVEIGAITEHLGPGTGNGLKVGTDLGDLGEELRQLREREADAKLRRLLDQAERKVAEEDYLGAITFVDQALSIDPASASALLLKAFCYYSLGDFDTALVLLAKAHEHATDAATVVIVLGLRAACEREALQEFEDELVELLERDRHDLALDLVQQRLRQHPTEPTLLYARAALLLSAGRPAAARAAAQDSLRVVGEPHLKHFQELLRHMAIRDSHELLESVRKHLRKGEAGRALAQLGACPVELHDSEPFESLRAYALERHAAGATLGIVRWARKRRAPVPPLEDQALQQLLCWLFQEELAEGVKALHDGQFDRARRCLGGVDRIDWRCDIVAFLYAVAIFRALQAAFDHDRPPSLEQADADLRRARKLATQACRDPAVGEQARALLNAISSNEKSLDEIRRRIENAKPVSDLVNRFNLLVKYFEDSPIRSMADLISARRMVGQLGQDIRSLRGRYPSGSEEGQALSKLAEAVQRIQSQLAG
jgi:tetratricopeptide (TPR) repeat protein